MSTYLKTPVMVPTERVPEFYRFFADWLASEEVPTSGDVSGQGELYHWTGHIEGGDEHSENELAAARTIYEKLSERGEALFRYLASQPDVRFTASELAEALDIPNGMYGVAGVLAWPARHAQAVGYHLPVQFEPGPAGHGACYWMPSQAAATFTEVMSGD